MTEFQALVTGAVAGALMKEGPLLIDVEVETEQDGVYTNRLFVTGRESGEKLVITVDPA